MDTELKKLTKKKNQLKKAVVWVNTHKEELGYHMAILRAEWRFNVEAGDLREEFEKINREKK